MRKMKKVLSLVLSLVLVCGIVAGFAACSGNKENNKKEDTTTQSDLAKIQAAGVLKVGITEYEPMNYKDKNGEWTGFDTEFAQALHEQVKAAKKAGKNAKAFKQAQEQALEQNAKSLLERVGLADKADAYPCQLSGGQQQRVAIARALAMSPDILCFDEPTSALDPELTGEVLNVIRSLKTGNSTMIVVTHEMEFARHVADQVLFMADGVIAESGTPEDLFNHPKSPALQAFLSKAQNK